MQFIIQIKTDSELVGYEALSLAMTLATFDHGVQLIFADESWRLLADKTSRVYGMIQSLELYDMPMAMADFVDEQWARLDGEIVKFLKQINRAMIDEQNATLLNF